MNNLEIQIVAHNGYKGDWIVVTNNLIIEPFSCTFIKLYMSDFNGSHSLVKIFKIK